MLELELQEATGLSTLFAAHHIGVASEISQNVPEWVA